jgi:predicted polyphosphate/ATP-dependent NAD kinase
VPTVKRIGFLINPIAGMGGRVGLKGTDGVAEEAARLGARPTAHLKANATLRELRKSPGRADVEGEIHWLTCSGSMGADALTEAGFPEFEVAFKPAAATSADDTKAAARRFLDLGVDLILFCGGDGTARDICSIVGQTVPILGIPAGVKMYSGVFGVNPARTAEILMGFLRGSLTAAAADVLDLDEDKYREGEWAVRLYHAALTPYEPAFTQSAKMLVAGASDAEAKGEIADYLMEEIDARPDTLLLLGPGSTVQAIGDALGIDKTLLGIDAVRGATTVGKDLNERQILDLLDRHPRRKLILSPIGAQGFVLGRGNLQLSPEVVKRIGHENIIVVATPAKLARTEAMRFDTGQAALDDELRGEGYIPVVIGYRLRRLVRTAD